MSPLCRLLPLMGTLLAGACSYPDLISATSGEKRTAYKSYSAEWKQPGSPQRFGRERSVQLFQDAEVQLTEKRLTIAGTMGMAALVSPDGYALTAAHVVPSSPRSQSILLVKDVGRAPVHIQQTELPVAPNDGGAPVLRRAMFMLEYGTTLSPVDNSHLRVGKVRVVKIFKGTDLALVKLPIATGRWFEIRDSPPPLKATVFASGNAGTPYRGASAGQVVAVRKTDRPVRTINTSAPLASGDSGGPVFDDQGHLIGIVSHVWPSRWLPIPDLDHSSLRMLDAAQLRRLIAQDRNRVASAAPALP